MSLEARLIHNAMTALRRPMPKLIRCAACRDLIDPCEACVAAWEEEGDRRRREAQERDDRD